MLKKNPCFQHIEDIADIVNDYFREIDLHFFGHIIVKPNGEFSVLNSGRAWTEDHFLHKRLPPVGFHMYDKMEDKVIFPSMDSGTEFGWSDDIIVEAKEKFNVENPMIITRRYQDHYEAFFFDLHGEKAYEQYINHFQVFENFTHVHKEKSEKLIKEVVKKPLMVGEPYLNNKHDDSKIIDTSRIPKPSKYYIKYKDHDVCITAKQYECLELLARGHRVNSISQLLDNSPRTIETHVNRLKAKFNVQNHTQLVAIFWDNAFIKSTF